MKMIRILIALIACFASPAGLAQVMVRPAVQYQPGEKIYGGATGAVSVVPEGWVGLLPRDSEVFLLMPLSGRNGEIYVMADSGISREERRRNWLAGLELDNGNVLRAVPPVFERNGTLAAHGRLDRPTQPMSAYIEARCGPYGHCLTALLICAPDDLEELQKGVYALMDSLSWRETNKGDFYADFDWQSFLAGKHLINHEYVQQGKAESDLWLCPDGTFRSRLRRTGLHKEEVGKYKGNHRGTWATNSVGAAGTLQLNFEKLPPVEVQLEIADDKIFINGKRFLVITATDCR